MCLGSVAIKSDTEIWNYCLRLSLQKRKQITVEYLEEFIPKRFNRHIESGNCVVDGCDQHRTLLINMTSLFLDENRKLKRFYKTLYCSHHFKQYRQFFKQECQGDPMVQCRMGFPLRPPFHRCLVGFSEPVFERHIDPSIL